MENPTQTSNSNEFRTELQISFSMVLVYLIVVITVLVFLTGNMTPISNQTSFLLARITLYSIIILAFVVHRLHQTSGKVFLIAALGMYLVYFAFELRDPTILYLLFIPVGLAAGLIGSIASLGTAAALSAILAGIVVLQPGSLSEVVLGLSLLAVWSMAGLVFAIYRPVYQLGDWSWNYYQHALEMMRESNNTRLELSQALDELLHTNRQLALANEKQLSFRIIAEEAQKTKAAFVAKVSHEFRTPLNMIIGLVNLMIDNPQIYGRMLPKAMLDDLVIIQRNCEHLTGMINDVLALSQAESGILVLHREYVDLEEIIEQALAVVSPLVKKKGLETRCTVSGPLPQIYCDRTRIRQVLLNLVSNAARFTETGGIYITIDDQPESLLITVRDTGPGIAPEDIERIFDPFCQGGVNSTWRDKGGTGLGLTISRQFIEQHGGKIRVESQPGAGAGFIFNLPKEQPIAPTSSPRRWINEQWDWVARDSRTRFSPEILHRPRIALYDPEGTLVDMLASYKDLLEFSLTESTPQLIDDLQETPANAVLVNGATLDQVVSVIDELRQSVQDTPLVGCVVPRKTWDNLSSRVAQILVKPITRIELMKAIDALGVPVKRILVVDNDDEILNLYSRMIKSGSQDNPYEVFTASSGREALDVMRTFLPNLVLLDISMPEMDGFRVLSEKDLDPVICDIPVMIISAVDLTSSPLQSQLVVATMANGLRPAKLVECALDLSVLLLKPDLTPDQVRG